MLNVVQPILLVRQLHDGFGGTQQRHVDAHQCLVSHHMPVARGEQRLKVIEHAAVLQQCGELLPQLRVVGFAVVCTNVKFADFALALPLHLIERKIGIAFEGREIAAVIRIPRHAAGNGNVHRVAGRQHGGVGGHGFLQVRQIRPERVAGFIAVQQDNKFVARKPRTDRVRRDILCKALPGQADVAVATVVSVGVVDALQVVQIGHQQRSMAHLVRVREHLLYLPHEREAVVQPGQYVVVALVLNAAALLHGGRYILHQTDLRPAFFAGTQEDVAHRAARSGQGVHFAAVCAGYVLVRLLPAVQDGIEPILVQRIRRYVRQRQEGEEIVRHIHGIHIRPLLKAADFHARQFHNALELD